ncbi:putative cyclin [Helianthus anomalus]
MDIRTKYKRLNVCRANLHTQEAIPSIFFEDAYFVNIFRYLQSMKNEGNRRTMAGYTMQVQKYITEGMKTIIIQWLFEVAEDHRFFQETLFCTVTYIDKYLSVRVLPR